MRWRPCLVLLGLSLTAVPACSDDSTKVSGSPAGTATSVTKAVEVEVWFLKDEKLTMVKRSVPASGDRLTAAVDQLITGPSATEAAEGLLSMVPAGVTVNKIEVASGTATIDLSGFAQGGGSLSMFGRLGQLVYTATQFEEATKVTLLLDGQMVDFLGGEGIDISKPMARGDVSYVSP